MTIGEFEEQRDGSMEFEGVRAFQFKMEPEDRKWRISRMHPHKNGT